MPLLARRGEEHVVSEHNGSTVLEVPGCGLASESASEPTRESSCCNEQEEGGSPKDFILSASEERGGLPLCFFVGIMLIELHAHGTVDLCQ